ncbi:segregation/condensation protein A [Patescibacteria group bacterium]|nr:segregation/condensation protein A [Patescibacteria group bacterium]
MYKVKLEQFQGPFHLLLKLIEKQEMDVSEISLAKVLDEFLYYIESSNQIESKELIDFLEIASRIILLKSRLLVLPGNEYDDLEGDDNLINRIKIYQKFASASKQVFELLASSNHSFSRKRIPLNMSKDYSVDLKITPKIIHKTWQNIVKEILKYKQATKVIKIKTISLRKKINELLLLVKQKEKIIFNNIINRKKTEEKIVIFLAMLELVKKEQIKISQAELFGEIIIRKK